MFTPIVATPVTTGWIITSTGPPPIVVMEADKLVTFTGVNDCVLKKETGEDWTGTAMFN